ncbi:pentapeptide repeat-containing protein [Streptomyces sp. BR123]|uniref:pentapeptide repeat-containing protein n=1 Tax=Streptomyces sp. BR123 TaxID=2749828 RepID=UPI00281139C5|nr:pentapeptide repeat-containing protein [Streptomyces sp. BR123]
MPGTDESLAEEGSPCGVKRDFRGADLVRANLDEAALRSARLDGAHMARASPTTPRRCVA